MDPALQPSVETTPAAIHAERLTKRYGSFVAVDALDLDVRPGEIVALLGKNGAGKTTLMRMLCGMLQPTAGRAWIAGHEIGADPVRARARLGYLDEEPLVYEHLSGREFMNLVADLYRVPRGAARQHRIDQLLALVELTGKQDELIAGYSHGMRGKIGLISLLLHEPAVLLLDEPTNGLDPPSARAVKTLLGQLAATGTAVVLSTHILEIAQALSTRVLILDRGRPVADGTVGELRSRTGDANADLERLFLDLTGDAEQSGILEALSR